MSDNMLDGFRHHAAGVMGWAERIAEPQPVTDEQRLAAYRRILRDPRDCRLTSNPMPSLWQEEADEGRITVLGFSDMTRFKPTESGLAYYRAALGDEAPE